jgi:hypothetical protein
MTILHIVKKAIKKTQKKADRVYIIDAVSMDRMDVLIMGLDRP